MSDEENKALNHVIFNNFIFLVCLCAYCLSFIYEIFNMTNFIISTTLLVLLFVKTAIESLKVMKTQH